MFRRPDAMYLKNFNRCEFIEGATLRRFMTRKFNIYSDRIVAEFVVRTPSDHQVASLCDSCVKRHHPTNLDCSMTLFRPVSYANNINLMYSFKSRKPISRRWTLLDVQSLRGIKLSIETYEIPYVCKPYFKDIEQHNMSLQ